jgi:hypothetical protein
LTIKNAVATSAKPAATPIAAASANFFRPPGFPPGCWADGCFSCAGSVCFFDDFAAVVGAIASITSVALSSTRAVIIIRGISSVS